MFLILMGNIGTQQASLFKHEFYYPFIRWSAWGVDQLRLVEVSKVAFSFCPSHQRAVESKRNWLRGCGFWHLAKLYSNAAIFICLKIFSFVLISLLQRKTCNCKIFKIFFIFLPPEMEWKTVHGNFYYFKNLKNK